jgi:hypothetical protein
MRIAVLCRSIELGHSLPRRGEWVAGFRSIPTDGGANFSGGEAAFEHGRKLVILFAFCRRSDPNLIKQRLTREPPLGAPFRFEGHP